jgi:HPt (histidine-containing phosphotransfer) domain-containing protein
MYQQSKIFVAGASALFHEPEFAVQLREDLALADVNHVLGLFAGDMHRLMAALRVASEAGQSQAMRRAAHALAGAAGAVGAVSLERACRAAMTGAPDDVAELTARFQVIETAATSAELALERVSAELMQETAAPKSGRA